MSKSLITIETISFHLPRHDTFSCIIFLLQCCFLTSNMNTSLPPSLALYIHQCIEQRSLTLLTSVLDTPANWLLVRFLYAAISGSKGFHGASNSPANHSGNPDISQKVLIVSIWRSYDLWSELSRKCVSHKDGRIPYSRF